LASCIKTASDTVPRLKLPKAEAVQLMLVATHDWHGQLFATKAPGVQGALPQGGALAFFAQLSALREAFPGRVLWADAGDMLHGDWALHPQETCLAAEAFAYMGLDFATLGEHDFGFPAGMPPERGRGQRVLQGCMARAPFAWSSANVYSTADGTRPGWLGGDKLHMVERQGVQVGFIGLTTPLAPLLVAPPRLEGLTFGDMALAARERALALRARGADVVVLVAHAQGECAQAQALEDFSECTNRQGEIGEVLEALPEGLIDVVVAGHGHKPLGHFFKGVPVVQTRGMGQHFSMIEFHWEPTERRLLREKTRVHAEVPICEKIWPSRQSCEGPPPPGEEAVPAVFFGRQLQVDERLEALLAPAAERWKERQQTLLGIEVGERLWLGEAEESALGGMLAESLLLATQADVALVHRGTFLEALEAGALSAGRFLQSMPQSSRVALVRFSGEELRRLMQLAFGQRRFLFDVAGVELQLGCFPSGRRQVHTQLVLADGRRQAVEDKAFYWVAMPEFLAQGGFGLEGMVAGAPPRQTKLQEDMRETVLHVWRQQQRPLMPPLRPRVLLNSCESPKTPSKEQL